MEAREEKKVRRIKQKKGKRDREKSSYTSVPILVETNR